MIIDVVESNPPQLNIDYAITPKNNKMIPYTLFHIVQTNEYIICGSSANIYISEKDNYTKIEDKDTLRALINLHQTILNATKYNIESLTDFTYEDCIHLEKIKRAIKIKLKE